MRDRVNRRSRAYALIVQPHAATVGDVASVITGVVTIALVVLTYFAVRSGGESAEAASKSADAELESARLAERQLQEAHRPLLLSEAPVLDGQDLVVPLRNIGVGPAMRVYGRAQIRNLPPDVRGRFAHHVVPGVAAGSQTALRFAFASKTCRA